MLDLWSEKLLLSSTEVPLVSIYSGTFTALVGGTQQTDIAVFNPPTIGDAVGMSSVGNSVSPIIEITSSYVICSAFSGFEDRYSFLKNVTIGGKPYKWFHTGGYAPVSVFTSPGAVAGDLAIINNSGSFYEGYPTIKAVTKDTITVSYYATGQTTTVQFKENVPDFIYRA